MSKSWMDLALKMQFQPSYLRYVPLLFIINRRNGKGSVDGREITRRFGNWELLIYTTCLLDVASGRDSKGIPTIIVLGTSVHGGCFNGRMEICIILAGTVLDGGRGKYG